MEEHPLVTWLLLKIDKETFIDLYLFIFIADWILWLVFVVLLDKQIHLTFNTLGGMVGDWN